MIDTRVPPITRETRLARTRADAFTVETVLRKGIPERDPLLPTFFFKLLHTMAGTGIDSNGRP